MTDRYRTTCATCGGEVEDRGGSSVDGKRVPRWVHVSSGYVPCYPEETARPPVAPATLSELMTLREHVHWLAGEHGRARAARDRYRAAWRSARERAAAAREEAARLRRRSWDTDEAVRRLWELHQPVGGCCGVCADEDGQAAGWPCATVRYLPRMATEVAARPAVPELVGVGEAAVLLGVSRQRAGQLINKRGFPRPVAELGCGSIFIADEVRRFAEARDRSPGRRKGPQPRRRPSAEASG